MTIFDCCPFFAEFDLLELRIAQLASVVDLFVIVEGDRTHAGQPKNLPLHEDLGRLKRWASKIYLHKATLPAGDGPHWIWRREIAQRNAIKDALQTLGARHDDMVLISDCDEIPKRDFVSLLPSLPPEGIAIAVQRLSYYTFNHIGPWWNGTRATQFANVQALGADGIRYINRERGGFPALFPLGAGNVLDTGGWHLSYFGGPDAIKLKMNSFLHQELNRPEHQDPETITSRIASGADVYGREGQTFDLCPHPLLPDAVYERPMRWKDHFLPEFAPIFHEDWMEGEGSAFLSRTARSAPDGLCLEIGAWEGASTIAIAHGLQGRDLHVVDTWRGNEEEEEGHPSVIAAKERDVYATFRHNLSVFDINNIVAHRMDWREWKNDAPIAFAHLDACHDEESVRAQIEALLPRMVPGGILVGDDFYSEGVGNAVRSLLPGYEDNERMWRWRKVE